MKGLKSIHLLIILCTFFCTPVLFGSPTPIFSFRAPERDSAGGKLVMNDRHAYDKMNYYDYYAGPQLSFLFDMHSGKPKCVSISQFWARFDSSRTTWLNKMENERFRCPKRNTRIKNSHLVKRMFHPHNTDVLFSNLVDSVLPDTTLRANKDTLAVKVCAWLVAKTDSLLKTWYDISLTDPAKDSLIIHQLAEEANYHFRDYSYIFIRRENPDTMQAMKVYANIMNAISAKAKQFDSLSTSIEMFYGDTLASEPLYKIAWFDTLLARTTNLNSVFFAVVPGMRPNYLSTLNNLTSKLGNRKIGIRYTWTPFSYATQFQILTDVDQRVYNKKYLSLYQGDVLDGKFSSPTYASIDPNYHWKALAGLEGKNWLVFFDHFEEDSLDDRLWSKSGAGTIVQIPDSSRVRIGTGAYIQTDTASINLGSLESALDKNGSVGSSDTIGVKALKDGSNWLQMYINNNVLKASVYYNGQNYGTQTITNPSGMHNYKITWGSTSAYFYYDGGQIFTYSFPSGRFDTVATKFYNAGASQYMIVDSLLGIYREELLPRIEITSTTANGNQVVVEYFVNINSTVTVYLERWGLDDPPRKSIFTVWSGSRDAFQNYQNAYSFDGSQTSGRYRWLIKAAGQGGGPADSAYGMGFQYNQGSNVALAGAKQVADIAAPALPKAFYLGRNYPNPFNPSTTIYYEIPDGQSCRAVLRIYNLRGQLVKTLVKEEAQKPGRYTVYWDGRDEKGRPVSSGTYFYRLEAGGFTSVRKMVLLK